ncbi:hypothetical protein BT96DRAFT_93737 [Gymnopus androsaceus JB14]|uniref:Uncharacterized protein n=1 Tax=Gymnopus androsaceus JB14 TaxID=1447944 RepID=A0A6A4GCR1_9AGAR|nr:hypothetical protein BT96DRAFT_93737 [Gymnopus androsaceus JB14]
MNTQVFVLWAAVCISSYSVRISFLTVQLFYLDDLDDFKASYKNASHQEDSGTYLTMGQVDLTSYLKIALITASPDRFTSCDLLRNRIRSWMTGELPNFVQAKIAQLESPRFWADWPQEDLNCFRPRFEGRQAQRRLFGL